MASVKGVFDRLTGKVFELEGRYALVAFRLIVLILLIFFVLYGRNGILRDTDANLMPAGWVIFIISLQLASNILLAFSPEKFLKKEVYVGFFLLDIVIISLAIYWTQGFDDDLFIIYFLVVFMTALSKKPSVSFIVAGLACVIYGFIFSKTHPMTDIYQPMVLIRFPLLLVVAFFSSMVVNEMEKEKESMKAWMQTYWMRSEKLAALGEMASSIAHEINNPMTSILGIAQLSIADSQDAADLAQPEQAPGNPDVMLKVSLEDMQAIERNVLRCKKVISELLKFSGSQEFVIQRINVKQPLNDALSLLQNRINLAGIKVQWQSEPDPALLMLRASYPYIQQVFFNILLNSWRAMPQGGILTLSIEHKSVVNDRNIFCAVVDVCIRDTGVGIPEDKLKKLFEPLFSQEGHTTRSETGLGLLVAQSIVARHNGKIFAESEGEGKGTKVTVRLPAADDSVASKAGAKQLGEEEVA